METNTSKLEKLVGEVLKYHREDIIEVVLEDEKVTIAIGNSSQTGQILL